VGVLHLPALPGAPSASQPVAQIAAQAAEDAQLLEAAGFTAVLLENFHDTPFRRDHADPETVAALAVVGVTVRAAVRLPLGFNVLRNDALAALGLAHAAAQLRARQRAGRRRGHGPGPSRVARTSCCAAALRCTPSRSSPTWT
jgi:predicted TIM-barrel enzyme